MDTTLPTSTYHPQPPPRRGEAYAWGLTLTLSVAALVWRWLVGPVPWPYWLFLGFFGLAALSISLGQWMDRHTTLRLEPEGVYFTNGVRRVFLRWEDILHIRVQPAPLGRRVEVVGRTGHFTFPLLTEVIFEGQPQGAFGFREGERILARMVSTAGLKQRETTGQEVYYGR